MAEFSFTHQGITVTVEQVQEIPDDALFEAVYRYDFADSNNVHWLGTLPQL